MNYGLYLSASGVLTNMYRQDVFANNLANVQTVGFKPDMPFTRQRDPESIEDNLLGQVSHQLLDRLGGGAFAGPQYIDFSQGPLKETGRPLDVALESPGTFFVVSVTDTAGNTATRLTRDGRFVRGADGHLVTVSGGHKVLNPDGGFISVPGHGKVQIDNAGNIRHNDQVVDMLQVTAVSDLGLLNKLGQNLFGFKGGLDPRVPAASTAVRAGHLESSGTDSVKALMELVAATKAISSNANMLRYHDLLMDRAVNTLGRVA